MKRWIVVALFLIHNCSANTTDVSLAGTLSFSQRPTFARLSFDVPLNFSSVYGKIEPVGIPWFVLFEIDHQMFPSTYPAVNEEIQAGDYAPQCDRFDAVREVEIEIELYPTFVRLRAGNSEKYEFLESIELGHEFKFEFFVQEHLNGPLCSIDVRIEQLETSKFSLPSTTTHPSIVVEPIELEVGQKTTSRRMLPDPGSSVTQTSRSWTGKAHSVTYRTWKSTTKLSNSHSYIDIQKDKEVLETVQRSRTKEINNVWSTTFLIFFSVELVILSSFVAFGLLAFVLLQIRPKTNKHIELVY